MDLTDGTVTNNATGELILASNFDKIFQNCETFANIAIITPTIRTIIKHTHVTEMFQSRVAKCIDHVKHLELILPKKSVLDAIGIKGNAVLNIEKLALFTDDKITKAVDNDSIATKIGRNSPKLKELVYSGAYLARFDTKVDLRHLTLKLQCTSEAFDNALAFIKACEELNELCLICEDPVEFNDGKPIDEIVGELGDCLHHDSENRKNITVLNVHNLVTDDRFGYNTNESTCHAPNVDLIDTAIPFDCSHLEIQRIKSAVEANKLTALMAAKKIESLTVGVDEALFKTAWESLKNYSNVVVRCENDKISNNTTGNIDKVRHSQQADAIDTIRLHVHTQRSLFALSHEIAALNVSFHAYHDIKLLDQLSNHILQMQAITNLFIGSDHGLFRAILKNFNRQNDFQMLSVVNVPKAALQPLNDIISLIASMLVNEKRRAFIIRNDDPRDRQILLLRDDLTKLGLGWSWNIDTDGCNIIGTKKLYETPLRPIAKNKSMTY